jgi:uncharacterized protein
MKYLIVFFVVVAVLWLVRLGARSAGSERRAAPRPAKPAGIEDMVTCERCGVHLPRSEALPGLGGVFCGEAHRAEHERETPRS